jgi:hypothetical protein
LKQTVQDLVRALMKRQNMCVGWAQSPPLSLSLCSKNP